MRIVQVRMQNLRSFKDETVVLDHYTCLVGPNGSGKSTVLTALNIFFRETENSSTNLVVLSREDFHQCNTKSPIVITLTFGELSDEAKNDLKGYVRQDQLVVSAVAEWDENAGGARVTQYGERLGVKEFTKYFELDKSGAKAPQLQEFYDAVLRSKFTALPIAKTKSQKEEALHAYETDHPDRCSLIPSADEFYGVSRGTDKINKFLQWVYVPAVKNAAEEFTHRCLLQAKSKCSNKKQSMTTKRY